MNRDDSSQRQAFIEKVDLNFSVQASAGAGKTTALVERVVSFARKHPQQLGNLVVVTYTNRAADEMRQRLRSRILKSDDSIPQASLMHGLANMFVGTIHSFCLRLIQENGVALGMPSEIVPIPESDSSIRRLFQREYSHASMPSWVHSLHRCVPERDILQVAYALTQLTQDWREIAVHFESDFADEFQKIQLDPRALSEVKPKLAKSLPTVQRWQKIWEDVVQAWHQFNGYVEIPAAPDKGGKELREAWSLAVGPLQTVLSRATLFRAMQIAAEFQEFRFRIGRLFFSDQIVLARRLLTQPVIRQRLLSKNFRILLDEAQDTDPLQFQLLTELARDPASNLFSWPNDPTHPPRPGHFVMVGDQQQAIYRKRAALSLYHQYHEALSSSPGGKALSFFKTFRCRPALVEFVNDRFRNVLDGKNSQAQFVPLLPQKDKGSGQTLRWTPPVCGGNSPFKTHALAKWLANAIREAGLEKLRARSWDEVAILCPSRSWLTAIQRALRQAGLASVLHFDLPRYEHPEYLWLSALLSLQSHPNNEFEIVGILREIFGISDEAIYAYRWSNNTAQSLALRSFENPSHPIEEKLNLLAHIRTEAAKLPLSEAVAVWCEQTHLRERLLSLPDGERASRGLDRLQLQAHQAEQRGLSIQEWVQKLQDDLESESPDFPLATEPKINLMTIQKSKGLEWDAVIIPFLGRGAPEGGKTEYPQILMPNDLSYRCGLNLSNFFTDSWETLSALDDDDFVRERRRLFYVACTRARHTLVLADDFASWQKIKKDGSQSQPKKNGYEALIGEAEIAKPWVNPLDLSASFFQDALTSEKLETVSKISASIKADSFPPAISSVAFSPLQKIRPSQHDELTADEPLAPVPRRSWTAQNSDPLRYGTWWHEMIRFWPWTDPRPEKWIARQIDLLPNEILRNRAKQETSLLLQSDLKQKLSTLGTGQRLPEVPYLLSPQENVIEEGIIDFLFQSEKGWILLDWKTDSLERDPAWQDRLRSRYTNQLQAYAEAARQYGLAIAAVWIYSTAQGKIVEL